MRGTGNHIFKSKHQKEHKLEAGKYVHSLGLYPVLYSSARPRLLKFHNLPNQCHQAETKCSDICAYRGHFSFRLLHSPPQGIVLHPPPVHHGKEGTTWRRGPACSLMPLQRPGQNSCQKLQGQCWQDIALLHTPENKISLPEP